MKVGDLVRVTPGWVSWTCDYGSGDYVPGGTAVIVGIHTKSGATGPFKVFEVLIENEVYFIDEDKLDLILEGG